MERDILNWTKPIIFQNSRFSEFLTSLNTRAYVGIWIQISNKKEHGCCRLQQKSVWLHKNLRKILYILDIPRIMIYQTEKSMAVVPISLIFKCGFLYTELRYFWHFLNVGPRPEVGIWRTEKNLVQIWCAKPYRYLSGPDKNLYGICTDKKIFLSVQTNYRQ